MSALEDRVCGSLGYITLEDVDRAARELGEFTRGELAACLGLKAPAVGRFLASLKALGAIEVKSDGCYRATGVRPFPDVPSEPAVELAVAPDPPSEDEDLGRLTPEELRDAAVALERFTIGELADYLYVDRRVAQPMLAELVSRGIVRETGKAWRRSPLYEHAPIVAKRGPVAPRRKSPEELAAEDFVRLHPRGVVAGAAGAPQPSQDKDVNRLVACAWSTGWPVQQRSKHWVILPPGATRPIPIPGTPKGQGMVRAFRDQLVRAGLDVPNVAGKLGTAVAGTGRGAQHKQSVQQRKTTPGNRRPTRRGPR